MKRRAVEIAGRLFKKVADVVAGGETLTVALDHHGADRRVRIRLLQGLGQLRIHGAGQGVFLVRAIGLQGQQPTFALLQDGVSHGMSRDGSVQHSTTGQEHIGQQLITRQSGQKQAFGKRLDADRVPAE